MKKELVDRDAKLTTAAHPAWEAKHGHKFPKAQADKAIIQSNALPGKKDGGKKAPKETEKKVRHSFHCHMVERRN